MMKVAAGLLFTVAVPLTAAAGVGVGPAPVPPSRTAGPAAGSPGPAPVAIPADAGPATAALDYALDQVGTPYVWGGERPGVGFDCSGLTQAAWAAAGVSIPRVADDQMRAGPPVPAGAPLAPGDLVFFGPAPGGPATHVGMVALPDEGGSTAVMVDAPHTGAAVRTESFPTAPGAAWGDDVYLGATAPAG